MPGMTSLLIDFLYAKVLLGTAVYLSCALTVHQSNAREDF